MVNYNADYSFMTLVDQAKGVIANIHYLKNSEVTSLPVQGKVHTLSTDKKGIVDTFRK